MTSIGMIHMACYCGATLFYLGNTPNGGAPDKFIESFINKLGSGTYGFFTSADGKYGQCPHCGLDYELPDPEIMDWLPFVNEDQFLSIMADLNQVELSKNGSRVNESL